VAAGKLEEARQRYQQSLVVYEKLAKDNPSSADAQRDVSISFIKLGDMLAAAGKPEEARQRYEQSLVIYEKLAKDNPSSADAQRDVGISLIKLGDVLVVAGKLEEARQRYEWSLVIYEKLARRQPEFRRRPARLDCRLRQRWRRLLKDVSWWKKALAVAEELGRKGPTGPPRSVDD